ncbi:MAG: VOC family protein, partial [Planctomycetota bacterium]
MHIPIERLVGDYERGRLSRRQLITHLAGLTALAAATGRAGAAEDDPVADPTFAATDLNHIALRVTDLDRSQAFYAKHLGLRVSSRGETSCFMQCRERNFLAMFKADEPA